MPFIVDMGRRGLGVDIDETDVEQLYRLGRKEEGRRCTPREPGRKRLWNPSRCVKVKFAREEKKQEVMENLKELRGANQDKIRRVSIAHDLT